MCWYSRQALCETAVRPSGLAQQPVESSLETLTKGRSFEQTEKEVIVANSQVSLYFLTPVLG